MPRGTVRPWASVCTHSRAFHGRLGLEPRPDCRRHHIASMRTVAARERLARRETVLDEDFPTPGRGQGRYQNQPITSSNRSFTPDARRGIIRALERRAITVACAEAGSTPRSLLRRARHLASSTFRCGIPCPATDDEELPPPHKGTPTTGVGRDHVVASEPEGDLHSGHGPQDGFALVGGHHHVRERSFRPGRGLPVVRNRLTLANARGVHGAHTRQRVRLA